MWTLLLIGAILLVVAVKAFHWLQARATIPSLHTRYVLITGCDSGFGRRLAQRLDNMGCHVFAACLTSSSVTELSGESSERLKALQMDVTKDEDIERALREVEAALPENKGLWAIVNNAGIFGASGVAEMMTRKDFLAPLEVNLLGMTQVTRMFLPLVRRERGRVVNTTSVVGRFALSPAPYVASKFAAAGYTDMLRRELLRHPISVHSIQPGAFAATNLFDTENIRKSVTRVFQATPPHVQQVYGHDFVEKSMEAMDMTCRYLMDANPEDVVDAYVHALTSKRPSTTYTVGKNGNFFFRPMWMMPEWLADWIISFMVTPPANEFSS